MIALRFLDAMQGPSIAGLVVAVLLAWPGVPFGAEEPDDLPIRVEVQPGPYRVGQGIELSVGVKGRDRRPELELPHIAAADIWKIETAFRPISASGIGQVVSGDNLFVTRLRIVPRRAGMLDVPPFRARQDDHSGRSQGLRLNVEPIPIQGRPADFLGGVGTFAVEAEAVPPTVRVGQELTFRVRVDGAAAWGSTVRPDIGRFAGLSLAPRIEPLDDDVVREPPSRTFRYSLRPTRPGEAVLPPVGISAFEPRSRRFMTRATRGVHVKVVAMAGLTAEALDYVPPPVSWHRRSWVLPSVFSVVLALGAGWSTRSWLRRRKAAGSGGLAAARRYAVRKARELDRRDCSGLPDDVTARGIVGELIDYARIGTGRPPGAMTPEEAYTIVAGLTGSPATGTKAAGLIARCDRALFAGTSRAGEGRELCAEAHGLFRALGRAAGPRRGMLSDWRRRTSD